MKRIESQIIVNREEIALMFRCHRSTVDAWVATGMPEISQRGKGNQRKQREFDLAAIIAWHLDRASGGQQEHAGKLEAAKARKMEAQADREELLVKRMTGELVPAAEVEEIWSRYVRGVRSKLLAMSDSIAGRLAKSKKAKEAAGILRAELEDRLNDLARFRAADVDEDGEDDDL